MKPYFLVSVIFYIDGSNHYSGLVKLMVNKRFNINFL